jgi:nucleotide-binding universal stress UspA family protein
MVTKKLLVAVDFSLPSIRALQTAIDLTRQLRGKLHIVYVVEMKEKDSRVIEPDGSDSIEKRLIRDLQGQIESLVEDMSSDEIEVLIEIEYADPTEGIVGLADKINADMIVMGTHGRTRIEHLLVGSVAESVLRKTSIPVILVRDIASSIA